MTFFNLLPKNATQVNVKVEPFLSFPSCVDFILEAVFSAPCFLLFCQEVTFLFNSILMQNRNKDALKKFFQAQKEMVFNR